MVVEELANGARASVPDDVVREIEPRDARVVQQVADQHAHFVVVHLAAVQFEHLQVLTLRHALGQ